MAWHWNNCHSVSSLSISEMCHPVSTDKEVLKMELVLLLHVAKIFVCPHKAVVMAATFGCLEANASGSRSPVLVRMVQSSHGQ